MNVSLAYETANLKQQRTKDSAPALIKGKTAVDPVMDFAFSTRSGLSSFPRKLESRFLYDERGSKLFDAITEQPEYYLTRTETEILAGYSGKIRKIAGGATIVELGSGSSAKTGYLFRAWLSRSDKVHYVPIDVSASALDSACSYIKSSYPNLKISGINSDYYGAFPLFSEIRPKLVLFLGSSIGNFDPGQMKNFLTRLSTSLFIGDTFLLGLDLVKEPSVIEAAYNDSAGITREFTLNLFVRMNRELGSNIDLSAIEHEALYNPQKEQVEICARFTRNQTITVRQTGDSFSIAAGEAIETEISRKFRLEQFIPYLEEFGFSSEEVFIDDKEWFALVLLRRVPTRQHVGGR
ncbi:MAG: dimethylhistidine N-methyltransferase [Geobacteraceae bacterium GWC2_48_7]|nr:MAG: dimethylhistidine N-methyltransferase [Geobacteraceae bacterium GWC2_48_7]